MDIQLYLNTVFRSACPAAWETGAWGACELDCTGQQSSGQVVATNEQDKRGHTTFGQEGGAKQKRASIGSAMSEKWATCEAGCGEEYDPRTYGSLCHFDL